MEKKEYLIKMLEEADNSHANAILKVLIEDNISGEEFARLFSILNIDVQLAVLDDWGYSLDLLYDIVNYSTYGSVINKIFHTYNIELDSPRINIEELFARIKGINLNNQFLNKEGSYEHVISIPSSLITVGLANKIWNENDVLTVRSIISDSTYCTDSTLLNEYTKEREKEFIDHYDEISELTKEYTIEKNPEKKKEVYNRIVDILHKYNNKYLIRNMATTSFIMNAEREFSHTLKEYVIDYSFEIPYANDDVLNDVNELMSFSKRGYIRLSPEKEELYHDVLHIEEFDDRKIIELFNRLKDINVIEMFYDDMKEAERIRNTDIKNNCLTKEEMESFRNEELSNKYGVDIYTPDDRPFIVLEKSIDSEYGIDDLPTGHSFSIVSDRNPMDTYFYTNRYIYDASLLNPNQIVHTYPTDSYTKYQPHKGTDKATEKINILMSANELIDNTKCYNEILFLEQGTDHTDMDNNIPSMKKMAVYCVNEIKEEDIERAKEEGLGIFLAYDKNKIIDLTISK